MKILLISDKSLSANDNRQAGDIVGIYEDDHVFSAHEQEIFTIVDKPETTKTVGEVQAQVETRSMVKAKSTDWEFEEDLERTEAWKDDKGNYQEIKVKPRFARRYEDGEIKENYSRLPENTEATLKTATTVKA